MGSQRVRHDWSDLARKKKRRDLPYLKFPEKQGLKLSIPFWLRFALRGNFVKAWGRQNIEYAGERIQAKMWFQNKCVTSSPIPWEALEPQLHHRDCPHSQSHPCQSLALSTPHLGRRVQMWVLSSQHLQQTVHGWIILAGDLGRAPDRTTLRLLSVDFEIQ